CLQFKTCPYSF
nr:immunoglobulin light chain junction region [Macaca mulatta]